MAANGTKIEASDLDNSGLGKQAGYKDGVIVWDAFQGLSGSNGQGGSFIHAPILVLAHEIVHAALGTTGPAAEQKKLNWLIRLQQS